MFYECPTCRYQVAPGETVEGACPVCGTQPERDQPGGSASDGELFNMKQPGYGQDMGGNPLQEGILGDWQNRGVRDESFASVRARAVKSDVTSVHEAFMKEAAHTFQVDMSQPQAMVHWGNLDGLGFYGAHINGVPVQGNEMQHFQQGHGTRGNQEPVNVTVEHPAHEQPVRAMIEHGAGMRGLRAMGDDIRPHVFQSLWAMEDGQHPWPSHIEPGSVPVPPRQARIDENWLHARTNVDLSWEHAEPEYSTRVANPLALGRAALPMLKSVGQKILPAAVAKGRQMVPAALKGAGRWGTRALALHGLTNALTGAGGQPVGQPSVPLRGHPQLSHITADLETPSSIPELGIQDGDPEKVDAHEVNDGDSLNPYGDGVNDIGGTGQPNANESLYGDEDLNDDVLTSWGFEPDDIQLLDLLPKLVEYAESDNSGLEDPDIRALYERMQGRENLQTAAAFGLPSGTGNPAPFAAPQGAPPSVPPTGAGAVPGGGNCGVCGSALGADGTCPNGHQGGAGVRTNYDLVQPNTMGLPNQQNMFQPVATGSPFTAKLAINDHQGPKNTEQLHAVAEYLSEQGREGEILAMLQEPWNYAEELAQVQNKLNKPPQDVTQPEDQQPPMPAMEEAPPGATIPGAQPGAPMMAKITRALEKEGADSIAPRCPKCGSATTGVESVSGSETAGARCHRCGHAWDIGELREVKEATPKVVAPEHQELHVEDAVNTEAKPAADLEEREDVREDHGGRQWASEDGQPLRVGQVYELHSAQFSIPDVVRVEAIKPDAIDLLFVGEYSGAPGEEDLSYKHEVTANEASMNQYSFVPYGARTPEEDEAEAPDLQDDGHAPGQTSDLSTPHEHLTHVVEELVRRGHPLKQATAMAREVLAVYPGYEPQDYTHRDDYWKPPTQRAGQPAPEEFGTGATVQPGITWEPGGHGRGLVTQDGEIHVWPEEGGTHHEFIQQTGVQPASFFTVAPDGTASPYSFEGTANFTDNDIALIQSVPGLQVQEPAPAGGGGMMPSFGSVDSHDIAMAQEFGEEQPDPDLAWIMAGNSPSPGVAPQDVPEGVDPDLAYLVDGGGFEPREAGARFTPSQQRDFIDEEGTARNADKLELDGTHYEVNWNAKGNAYNAPDEHMSLGLL